jgi:hypothetical protein
MWEKPFTYRRFAHRFGFEVAFTRTTNILIFYLFYTKLPDGKVALNLMAPLYRMREVRYI